MGIRVNEELMLFTFSVNIFILVMLLTLYCC